MTTDQFPYLEHKSEGGSHTIWLPHSSQLGKYPDRLDSNNQYSEIYKCPACALVSSYRSPLVQWSRFRSEYPNNSEELYAAVLEFQCETENCEAQVRIRVPMQGKLDRTKLLDDSASWTLVAVRCPKGHPVTSIPERTKCHVDYIR